MASLLLPVVLVIRMAWAPHFPPIQFERFETEFLCQKRLESLRSTPFESARFLLTCEVDL